MPTPDFPVGVPPWATNDDVKGYVGMLSQRLFNLLCNLDSLNVTRLDAGTIQVYDLNGGSGTITLDGNGMVVNNGTYNSFTVDVNGNVTMTSATIQSATAYPKYIMDPTNNVMRFYTDANHYIEINPIISNAPTVKWVDPASTLQVFINPDGTGNATINNSSGRITLSSSTGDIRLSPSASGNLQINSSSGTPLNGYTGTLTVVTGVDFTAQTTTTKTITYTKGIVTSVV